MLDRSLLNKKFSAKKTYMYFLGEEVKPHIKGYNYHALLEKIKNKQTNKSHVVIKLLSKIGLRSHVSRQLNRDELKLFLFYPNALYYRHEINASRTTSYF